MKWITRERPQIDRIACPWLIKRFIDKDAEFFYVPFDEIIKKSKELDAIPFDIPGVEHTHYGDKCTFDYFIKKYDIKDPAIDLIAVIVRGADTDKHELAAQSSGLWAISVGLSYNIINDVQLLEFGMIIYDALYSWAKYLQNNKHGQIPNENLLIKIYELLIKDKNYKVKPPKWARELKEHIQDLIDTNFSLSLKEISKELDMNPTYLSREFSKYFDNLSFGEYIRKLRIDKAKHMIESSSYTLAEISFLTGFSDQSHFTRIFKKYSGMSPSEYKKINKKK